MEPSSLSLIPANFSFPKEIENNVDFFSNHLPNEIIIKIFSLLRIQDISSIARVSRKFNLLSVNSEIWRCIAKQLNIPIENSCAHPKLSVFFTRSSIFTYLPTEISLKALSFLDRQNLSRVMRTSKEMYSLASDEQIWKKAVRDMSKFKLKITLKEGILPLPIFCVLSERKIEMKRCPLTADLRSDYLVRFLRNQISTQSLDKIKKVVLQLIEKGLKISDYVNLYTIVHNALSSNELTIQGIENLTEFLKEKGMKSEINGSHFVSLLHSAVRLELPITHILPLAGLLSSQLQKHSISRGQLQGWIIEAITNKFSITDLNSLTSSLTDPEQFINFDDQNGIDITKPLLKAVENQWSIDDVISLMELLIKFKANNSSHTSLVDLLKRMIEKNYYIEDIKYFLSNLNNRSIKIKIDLPVVSFFINNQLKTNEVKQLIEMLDYDYDSSGPYNTSCLLKTLIEKKWTILDLEFFIEIMKNHFKIESINPAAFFKALILNKYSISEIDQYMKFLFNCGIKLEEDINEFSYLFQQTITSGYTIQEIKKLENLMIKLNFFSNLNSRVLHLCCAINAHWSIEDIEQLIQQLNSYQLSKEKDQDVMGTLKKNFLGEYSAEYIEDLKHLLLAYNIHMEVELTPDLFNGYDYLKLTQRLK